MLNGERRFSASIHGARGLFSLAIVIFHVANSGLASFPRSWIAEQALMSLMFGVELFFAISGFVILRSVFSAQSSMHFLSNRAARIFPVLWATVMTIVLLSLVSGRELPATLEPLSLLLHTTSNLLALPGILPLPLFHYAAWTLSFEWAFYLLCFVWLLVRERTGRNLALPILLIGLCIAVVYPRALFFLAGMLVGSGLLHRLKVPAAVRDPLIWLLIFLVAWQTVALDSAPYISAMWKWSIGDFPLAVAAFTSAMLMMQGLERGEGWLGRALATRQMLWLGTISYSLYLWHPIVLAVVKQVMIMTGISAFAGPAAQLLFLALALPPSLMLAHISHAVLEDRLMRLVRQKGTTAPLPAE